VWALCPAAQAYTFSGRWDEGIEEGREAMRLAEEFSDNSLISFTASVISLAYYREGNLDRGLKYGELAVEKAPTPTDKLLAQGMLAWAWFRSGELQRGIETLEAVVSIFRSAGATMYEIMFSPILGEGYWLAGEYDKARQTVEEALGLAEQCEFKSSIGSAHYLLGEIALKTNPAQAGEPQAGPCFEKAVAVFQETKAENSLAVACAGYGRFHKQQGDMAQAREYLNRALEIFERLGTLIEPDKVREELSGLA
jgi:tetratricopeptide (TPR) repeat protein